MKRRTKKTALAWLLTAVLLVSSLAAPDIAAAKTVTLKNGTTVKYMPVGSTFQVQTNVKASKLTFTTSKKKVAAVSKSGLIQAKKMGKTVIKIKYGKSVLKMKVTVKKPTGYTISKRAGTYTDSVTTKVKAKKGYNVYYTTSGTFRKAAKIPAGGTKSFTLQTTTTLKLYPVKASVGMTTKKLNKKEKSDKNRGDYLYTLKKGDALATATAAATGAPDAAAGSQTPAASGSGNPAAASQSPVTPSQNSATPWVTAAAETSEPAASGQPAGQSEAPVQQSSAPAATAAGTEIPSEMPVTTGDISSTASPEPTSTPINLVQPGESGYVGDDADDYVLADAGVFEESDYNVSTEGALSIVIPRTAPSGKQSIKREADGEEVEVAQLSKKNKLTILRPGTYLISTEEASSGESEEEPVSAWIEVAYDANAANDSSQEVHLILDGVNLTFSDLETDKGLINIKNGDTDVSKATLTILNENSLTDIGAQEQNTDDHTVGVMCKKGIPLTINGSGALKISSEYGNGIQAKDLLKVIDTTINAVVGTVTTDTDGTETTGHNGITGKTGLYLQNAHFTVDAVGDALKTTLDETDIAGNAAWSEMGNISIVGGTYEIISQDGDAISAYRTLYLCPDEMTTTTRNVKREATAEEDSSCKAIKAGTTIYIPATAGTITADTTATYDSEQAAGESNDPYADDTLHSDGYICINGVRELNLYAGDDGIHADQGLLINGGTIRVAEHNGVKAYEGLEAADISIYGGEITVETRDDGINAGGGSNSSSQTTGNNGPGGGDSFWDKDDTAATDAYQIIIAGGEITIDAEGDGIDSNGNIFMKGGRVTVNGPTQNNNGALDYGDRNNVCEISGGILIAAGAKGMEDSPTSGSTQPVVNVVFDSNQAAGTLVILKNTDGEEVLRAQPTKSFGSVILSCPELTLGETYTVWTGTSEDSLTQYKSITFTSTSITTGSSSTGGWTPGGFGGGARNATQQSF